MKALIRKSNETIIESDGIVGIDWNTGAPLTNRDWSGGPYTLVNDYAPEVPIEEKPAEQPSEPLPETVMYGGKEYTLEELKKLIG